MCYSQTSDEKIASCEKIGYEAPENVHVVLEPAPNPIVLVQFYNVIYFTIKGKSWLILKE